MMTVQEAAVHLRVSERTIWRLLASGDLHRVKVRKATRIPRTSIDSYVNQAETGATA